MTAPLTPLHKSITVPWAREPAFRRFTQEMSAWWPLATHSVGGALAREVRFEGVVGGRIVEVDSDGAQHVWGTVTAWEPPSRVAFTWHPGRPADTAQQIEVRFVELSEGTRVDLTHTGWEKLGAEARKARRGYPIGWAYVLRLYADRGSSPLVVTLDLIVWLIRAAQRMRRRPGARRS